MDVNNYKSDLYYQEAHNLNYNLCKPEEADLLYRKAIHENPKNFNAIDECANNLRLNLRDYWGALGFYNMLVNIDEEYEYALFRRGLCKEAVGDIKGRLEDLTRLTELFSDNEDYFRLRIRMFLKLKQYNDAIMACNDFSTMFGECFSVLKMKAEACKSLGFLAEYLECSERALKVLTAKFPNFQFIDNYVLGYGKALYENHKYEEASIIADKLLCDNPFNSRYIAFKSKVSSVLTKEM